MFFFFFFKKFAKGLDRTVLTGSSGPTPVLTVHGINKKSGSLGLKNRFSSRFPVFTIRPPGPVRFWKQWMVPHIWRQALTISFVDVDPPCFGPLFRFIWIHICLGSFFIILFYFIFGYWLILWQNALYL